MFTRRLTFLCVFLFAIILCAAPAPIILIATGSARKGSPDVAAMTKQTAIVKKSLDALGIASREAPDDALTSASLAGIRLVIFPHNAPLPSASLKTISDFVGKGGKIIVFFSSDGALASLLHLAPPTFVPGKNFGKPAQIRFTEDGRKSISGLPSSFPQSSWNCVTLTPSAPDARVIGIYATAEGSPLEPSRNAVVLSPNGAAFAHILQRTASEATDHALLAILGHYLPELWHTAAAAKLSTIGFLDGCASFRDSVQKLQQDPRAAHLPMLTQAIESYSAAQQAFLKKDFPASFAYSLQADTQLQKAYIQSRRSRPSEMRGAWIHSAYGLYDKNWDATVKVLKDNGFNTLFVNFCWGYVADYPSQILPVHPDVAKYGDQIEKCLAACKKYGIQLHAWKVCWNMGHRTSPENAKKMKDAQRTQIDFTGKDSTFLAPHIPENQDLEVNALVEIVKKYDLAGVHLDYIRYPDEDCDYSPSARSAFQKATGITVQNWPADCGFSGKLRAQYNLWRRNNITTTVQKISRAVHAARPGVMLSAAVYGGWDSAPYSVAQSADLWVSSGLLDFVVPMDYTPDNTYFRSLIERNLQGTANRIPLYIGIGSYQHTTPTRTAEQIEIARQMGADGFVCFSYNPLFASTTLPALTQGPTRLSTHGTPFPHTAPHITYHISPSKTPLPPNSFTRNEQINITLELPKDFNIPAQSVIRLLYNGHYLAPQPAIASARKDNVISCAFLPPSPGDYRLELSDDTSFVSRSQTLHVLSDEEVRKEQTYAEPPKFAMNGLPRVAVWQERNFCESPILTALKKTKCYDAAPLHNLNPASLAACQVVIIPQPRRQYLPFQSKENLTALRSYIANGGHLIVTGMLCGIRWFPTLYPTIASAVEPTVYARNWKLVPSLPETTGLPPVITATANTPMTILVSGAAGRVIATDITGKKSLIVSGKVGKGLFTAIGIGMGFTKAMDDSLLTPQETLMLQRIIQLGNRN